MLFRERALKETGAKKKVYQREGKAGAAAMDSLGKQICFMNINAHRHILI